MSRKPMVKMSSKDIQCLLIGTGLSRQAVAEKLSVSIFAVNKWVSGEQLPSEYIDKLMSLQQKMAFIFNEKGNKRSASFGPKASTDTKSILGSVIDTDLVDELERRGWSVTLNRQSPKKKHKK